MTYTSAPKRAISLLLAFVLTVTLIPSAAIAPAYAEPSDSSSQNAEATDETNSSAAQSTDEDTLDSDVAEAAAQDSAAEVADSADAPADPERPTGVVAQTETLDDVASDTVEVTRASVNLNNGQAPSMVFTQAGLTYQVNGDQETVSVVGVDPTMEAVQLSIPQTVTSGGKEFETTALICGGGFGPLC